MNRCHNIIVRTKMSKSYNVTTCTDHNLFTDHNNVNIFVRFKYLSKPELFGSKYFKLDGSSGLVVKGGDS